MWEDRKIRFFSSQWNIHMEHIPSGKRLLIIRLDISIIMYTEDK